MQQKHLNRFIVTLLLAGMAYGCSDDEKEVEIRNSTINNQRIGSEDGAKITETAPEVNDQNCIKIDLANPSSSDENVEVGNVDGSLTIVLKSETKSCIHLAGAYDGNVTVNNKKDVDADIILDNVKITSNNNAGYLKLKATAEKGLTYNVKLVGENEISGNSTEDCKKVINCAVNMNVFGEGSLQVNAAYKTGIGVDDVFHLYSGNVGIKVDRTEDTITQMKKKEKGFGAKITNGFIMSGGNLNIVARDSGTAFEMEARGLKVDGADCELLEGGVVNTNCYGKGKGYIKISGGTITINSDAKALSAGWDVAEDFLSEDTADDPEPNFEMTGGVINIKTYIPRREEELDEEGNVKVDSCSPEGIEGKHDVRISGGEIFIDATDDGIQAGNIVEIKGGKIVAMSKDNDAIDSNTLLNINGGLVVALGEKAPEGGLDADYSCNVTYTAGTLIAIGGYNNQPSNSKAAFVQYSLVENETLDAPQKTQAAGKILALTAPDSDEVLAAVKVPADYDGGNNVLIMHPKAEKGKKFLLHEAESIQPLNPNAEKPDFTWFGDIIMNGNGIVVSKSSREQEAGVKVGKSRHEIEDELADNQ